VYSPNSYLVAAGVILGEFSNVGEFVALHDVVILSEHYLQKDISWTAIVLLVFLIGFFFEELHDLYLSYRTSSLSEREEAKRVCGPGAPFYLYLSSLWNIMDVIMIVSGFAYLLLQNHAAQALDKYTLHEVWFVASEKQIAEVFGSITIVLAFFRIMDYLTLWEFLGILIITIFKMMADIIRFLFIFIIVVIGFSAGFHLSYTGNGIDTWDDFVTGTLTTFLTSPTGYYIPEYGINVLGLAGTTFGLVSQVIYVFIGIVLLLNLLVALMWETYNAMCEQATVEYRWHVTQPFKTGFVFLWHSPFTTLHVVFLTLGSMFRTIGKWCGYPMKKKYSSLEFLRERSSPGLPTNKRLLTSGMVVNFFRTVLSEDTDYKRYLASDITTFSKDTDEKGKEHDL